MITIISFLIVLGILIFIHEFGHFAVAKMSGVGVERFALGFGPRILKVKRKETEYCISIVPFGGYVKMTGEEPGESVDEENQGRSFTHKSILTRGAIIGAGSFMNLVLALFLFPVIFMAGVAVPAFFDDIPQIGYVAKDSLAYAAGLKKGDVVQEADGKAILRWEELYTIMALSSEKPLELKVERGETVFNVTLKAEPEKELGVYPRMDPVIGGVTKDSPAEKAGLKTGDRIKSIDGFPITHWLELQEFIRKDGRPKRFIVERDGEKVEADITPAYDEERKAYLIGVMQTKDTVTKRYGFFEAVGKGLSKAWELTLLFFAVIKGLIVGEYSLKALGGPILIAQVAGAAAETGIVELISLIAFLSLQLGIINLFPIPVLDGGHLFFLLIERIKGKPLSEKVLTVASQIGMALIIVLMVLVTWNDIMRTFGWG